MKLIYSLLFFIFTSAIHAQIVLCKVGVAKTQFGNIITDFEKENGGILPLTIDLKLDLEDNWLFIKNTRYKISSSKTTQLKNGGFRIDAVLLHRNRPDNVYKGKFIFNKQNIGSKFIIWKQDEKIEYILQIVGNHL